MHGFYNIYNVQYKYDGYARDRDRDRYGNGNVNDFSVIEDSFYRPRKGDIIIEEFSNQYDYPDDERHERYYQKSPKYEARVSVASSHGRPEGPEYPHKTRPVLLGMFIKITNRKKNKI